MSKISLPACSLEELESIIVGFTKHQKEATNEDISKITALSEQYVSRSKGFLQELEIIEGGREKKITNSGADFGRAIEHSQSEIVAKNWRNLVSSNEFLSGLVTTLRLKKKMTKDEFESHILYASNATKNQWNKRGAKTIIEIFEKAGLIEDVDGELSVASDKTFNFENSNTDEKSETEDKSDSNKNQGEVMKDKKQDGKETETIYSHSKSPTININIQLQIPESDDPEIYNSFFKALKEHLLDD